MGSPSVSAPLPLAFHMATVRHHFRNQACSISRRRRRIRSSWALLSLDAFHELQVSKARKRAADPTLRRLSYATPY
ncbi:NolZ [Bradyrhizobium diazoefficiens USDA 110]|uniref:NolZ n=4 Tax=Bradyrhizobium TaxID=374 RepID=Q89TG2_BRADU|nr:NolZ [Bradyrhizobium japonicum SEMIA 5079]AJA67107.1 NolZ [Bradyrhizobium japonicum]AND87567.1 NolZ [Bradyrhizobium diazoefficiens USDA 110]APO50642.1 NolZ [Bradyrhizobium diazoefficiens]KGJ67514.1 putative NolZ [Bradyrhizobium diazoefficiens SEMIA 5080]BAL13085.1 hypothetical protein BJ6T_78390 [Bradyrhizobium japonicum USDA 6]